MSRRSSPVHSLVRSPVSAAKTLLYERHLARLEATNKWTQGQTLTLEQAAERLNTVAAPRTRSSGS
jgi:hypothetical protein